MKFVHIADMHFDCPFSTLFDRGNLGEIRRIEQRDAFKKMIDYIKEKNIPFLFISGDLYENEYVKETTIKYINDCFKEIPNTKIFIAPGNHDPIIKNSYYKKFEWNKNVKIFDSKIEKVELDNLNIYGFGFNDFYCSNCGLKELVIEEKEKLNILVIHGTLNGASIEEKEYNSISEKELIEKGFDYVALGHIHKSNFIDRKNNKIIYPGATISHGFDELGKHGMIVGDINKDKLNLEFIPLDNREFKEIELDCTEINTIEELIEKINLLELEDSCLYKLILIGNRNFEINIYDIYKYEINKKIIKIKDNTKIKINIEELSNENTLIGLFVRQLNEKIRQTDDNEEIKILEKAIEIGIEALKD